MESQDVLFVCFGLFLLMYGCRSGSVPQMEAKYDIVHESATARNEIDETRENKVLVGDLILLDDETVFDADEVMLEDEALESLQCCNDTFDNICNQNMTGSKMDVKWVKVELGEIFFNICDQIPLCRNRCFLHTPENIEGDRFLTGRGDHNVSSYNVWNPCGDEEAAQLWQVDVYKTRLSATGSDGTTPMEHSSESNESVEQHQFPNCNHSHICNHDNVCLPNTTDESNNYDYEYILPPCYCDDLCIVYGDCCLDVFEYVYGLNETNDVYDLISILKSSFVLDKEITDLKPLMERNSENEDKIIHKLFLNFATCENIDFDTEIMMVSRCPVESADHLLVEKCLNSSIPLLPPVTAVLPRGNITFKNIFCANCFGLDKNTLKIWSTNIACSNESEGRNITKFSLSNINEFIKNYACKIIFSPSFIYYPRYCLKHKRVRNEFDNLDNDVKNRQCSELDSLLCSSYVLPLNGYKNPHCQRCLEAENVTRDYSNVTYDCPSHVYSRGESNGGSTSGGGGITLILDLTGTFSLPNDVTSYLCEDGEVYDAFISECRPLECAFGQEPYRGKCFESKNPYFVSKSSQMFPEGYTRLLAKMSITYFNSNVSCGYAATKLVNFFSDFKKMFQQGFGEQIEPPVQNDPILREKLCNKFTENNETKDLIEVNEILICNNEVNIEKLNKISKLTSLVLENWFLNFSIFISNMGIPEYSQETCSKNGSITQRSDFRLVELQNVTYAIFNSTKQGVYYPINNIGFEIVIKASSRSIDPLIINAFLCQPCKLFLRSNCSVVTYWLNETQLSNSQLLILKSNQHYVNEDFEVHGNTICVCSNFGWNDREQINKENFAYFIISCVCTVGSVTFLSIMLLFYCMFPVLRTLPGKMMANLAWTMMLTFLLNLLSMVNINHDYICPVMAAVSHVITLAYFGWMTAIAVNMALTFGPQAKSLIKRINNDTIFRRFNFVIWGLSSAIVTLSVILDFSTRPKVIPSGMIDVRDSTSITTSETTASVTSLFSPPSSSSYLSTTYPLDYPRYGYTHCTWFSGPLWARLSFIIIPYLITFIINFICFVLTIIGIQKSRKISEKVRKKPSERVRCLLFLKLSTAMGFCWVLSGFVNIFPDSKVLPCIYACLVLLQGILLFLAFMANKRVYALIVNKLNTKMRRKATPESNKSLTAIGLI